MKESKKSDECKNGAVFYEDGSVDKDGNQNMYTTEELRAKNKAPLIDAKKVVHEIHGQLMARLFGLCKQVEGGWLIPDNIANEISDSIATKYEALSDSAKEFYRTIIEN
jgi:hypothetical protein